MATFQDLILQQMMGNPMAGGTGPINQFPPPGMVLPMPGERPGFSSAPSIQQMQQPYRKAGEPGAPSAASSFLGRVPMPTNPFAPGAEVPTTGEDGTRGVWDFFGGKFPFPGGVPNPSMNLQDTPIYAALSGTAPPKPKPPAVGMGSIQGAPMGGGPNMGAMQAMMGAGARPNTMMKKYLGG